MTQVLNIGDWTALERALIHILELPGTYSQSTWSSTDAECGSVRCVAGWVAHLHPEFELANPSLPDGLLVASAAYRATRPHIQTRVYDTIHVATAANIILKGDDAVGFLGGVNADLEDILFAAGLTWEQILCNVVQLAAEDGYTLDPRITEEQARTGHDCSGYLHRDDDDEYDEDYYPEDEDEDDDE